MKRVAMVLLSASAITSTATAQPPAQSDPAERMNAQRNYLGIGFQFTRATPVLLLGRQSVQEEIKLTPAQKARLKEINEQLPQVIQRATKEVADKTEAYMAARRAIGQPYEPEVLEALAQEKSAVTRPLGQARNEALLKVLDRRQRTRLEEIQLQADGPMGFTRPEIQEKLNMGPDQVEAIGEILAQGREDMIRVSALPPDLSPTGRILTPEERGALRESKAFKSAVEMSRKAAARSRTETMRRIGKVLTKGQHAKYEKMLGEPFDLARLRAPSTPGITETKPEKKAP